MSIAKGTKLGGIHSLADLKGRCVVDAITGCWLWREGISNGRPAVNLIVDGKRCCLPGRRAAVILDGRKPRIGDVVWRAEHCADQLCVNPAHTKIGSQSQACLAYEKREGWRHQAKRIRTGLELCKAITKLNAEQASAIREAEGTHKEIAEKYGITRSHVGNIKSGRNWTDRAVANNSVFSWRPAA